MTTIHTGEDISLAFFVRSLFPKEGRDQQAMIVDWAEELLAGGRIGGYTVTVWGRQIPSSREDAWMPGAIEARERVRTFREWARRNGFSLKESFRTRTMTSMANGERVDAIVVPCVAMAEYHGRDLYFVAPVRIDGEHHTVVDRLRALQDETDTAPSVTPVRRARAAPEPESEVLE